MNRTPTSHAAQAGIDLDKLEALARAATPQNFDSAQTKRVGGWGECPTCGGDGSVTIGNDYCNYDMAAQGVQFYGIGDAHVKAEAFYRAANPAIVLALISLARNAAQAAPAAQAVDAPSAADDNKYDLQHARLASIVASTAPETAQADDFDSWWTAQIAANGGTPIGADYRHWAEQGYKAAHAQQDAAPDLLDALKLIAAEAAGGAGSTGPAGWMGAIARVAIAKATATGKADAANAGNRVLMDQWNAGAALLLFQEWKGYPLPKLNADGNFDKDWLHREWVAFQAGLKRRAPATSAADAKDAVLADVLNTTLWLYRRLPQAYGSPPFVDKAILTMAERLGLDDVPEAIKERAAIAASQKGEKK